MRVDMKIKIIKLGMCHLTCDQDSLTQMFKLLNLDLVIQLRQITSVIISEYCSKTDRSFRKKNTFIYLLMSE